VLVLNIDITWWLVAVFIFDLVIRIWAIIVIPRNRRPTAATAWLLAIYFIPFVGLLLFFLIGNPRLPRIRRRKQRQINEYIHDATENLEFGSLRPDAPAWFTSLVTMNRNLGAMPLAGDNTVTLIAEYQDSLDAMAEAVRAAQQYAHVEFYILQSDSATDNLFRAMEEACARGVTVRVLLDHWANRGKPFYKATLKRLDAMGAHWHLMLPVQPFKGKYQRPDLRNHRKLLVVDGEVAFTGSQNIIDPGYEKRGNARRGLQWKDFMVRFEGPVVAGIDALFVTDWYAETNELLAREAAPARRTGPGPMDCQVVPSGPGFVGENNLRLFNSLVYAAQKKVILVSPYFVPDDSMLYAITTAAQSGLDVQLFVSEIGDQFFVYHAQRSYYEALLRAGVRIFLYRSPTILHAKHFTIDDEVSVIGSSNMDMRSFSLDFEISVMIWGGTFLQRLRAIENDYRENSRELTLDEWLARPVLARALDNVARLTAAVQ
jgi:cardiolipin synthase